MRDADYYPAGAYNDPNAPYNQVEPPEIEAEVNMSFTLERIATITTDEVWWDEDGWELAADADIGKAYDDYYVGIPEMLEELQKYVKGEMEVLAKFIKTRTANKEERGRYRYLQRILDSAGGWEVTDSDAWKA
jgi:hypothetical protein